jgi:hypothetical protein
MWKELRSFTGIYVDGLGKSCGLAEFELSIFWNTILERRH